MTDSKLANTVARAIEIDRQIEELELELKELKASLIAEAESRQDEHTPTEKGGTSWTAKADDGAIARVTFPAPSLKSTIDPKARGFDKVIAYAGTHFDALFISVLKYKPVEDFREKAVLKLGVDGKKLIKVCQSASEPKVAFETRKPGE